MLLIADILADRLQPAAYELAEFARRHSELAGERAQMVFAGRRIQAMAGETAGITGMDGLVVEHEALFYPDPDMLVQCLMPIVRRSSPRMIVFIHSMRAVQAAATLAWKLGGSCIPGVEAVTMDEEGLLIFQRAVAGGKLIADVKPWSHPAAITIMPGAFAPEKRKMRDNGPSGRITTISPDVEPRAASRKLETAATDNHLEEADVVVAVGRGVGAPEHLAVIRDLASLFNSAAVGASRPLCDLGWMPMDRQIGVTGRTVSPRLYLACGISGTQQHVAGMRGARLIVAVNHDRYAPMFNIAHIGIVEDLHAFLPLLIETYRRQKNTTE